MTPSLIRAAVISERVSWVRKMISLSRALPLETYKTFTEDPRNAGAAESYLRRGIEALLDIGRHILAKGFAVAVSEYKEIGPCLVEQSVLSSEDGLLLRRIAGYRNRMVHFYSEVTKEELYLLTTQYLTDIDRICDAIVQWIRENPDKIDHDI